MTMMMVVKLEERMFAVARPLLQGCSLSSDLKSDDGHRHRHRHRHSPEVKKNETNRYHG